MSISNAPSESKSSRKIVLAAVIVAIPLIVLLAPALVYGGFTVPVRKVTFSEQTGSLFIRQNATVTVEAQSVYEYIFVTKASGRIRTADTDVDSSNGVANITITMKLTNPSGPAIDLGSANIRGSAGVRNHTIYLGVDEGVRVPGSYQLDITIMASVALPIGGIDIDTAVTISARFTVS